MSESGEQEQQSKPADPLLNWKLGSSLLFSFAVTMWAYKCGLSGFAALLFFFPVKIAVNGLLGNQPADIAGGVMAILLFPVFTGSLDLLEHNLTSVLPADCPGTVRTIIFYIAATVFYFIGLGLTLAAAKLIPCRKLPDTAHKICMTAVFAAALLGGMFVVYSGINYCSGRIIALPGIVSFFLPLIILFFGIMAGKQMMKKVWDPDYCNADEASPAGLKNFPDVTLDDVAGMEEAKEQIRMRMIEPMRNPGEARRYGLKKGGGIMLYGPPGTGKTFLARAVAGELKIPFFMITAADVFSKYVGDSEKKIKEFFDNARKHPLSVIFVDEMEAIFSKRTDNVHEVTQRIVSVILQELDGIDSEKNPILLLGATNTPWKIDEAFLRPGRFDVHVFVDLPDMAAREQILKNAFKDAVVKCENGFFEYFVSRTGGFSGADLAGAATAVRQAAFSCKAKIYSVEVVKEVLDKFSPAANSEIAGRIKAWRESRNPGEVADKNMLAERPGIRLDDVAGMEEVKRQIRLRLIEPVKDPELARQYGLKKGGGIMLYGPPGTGKTFLARAVAGELDLPFYIITAADIFTKYVGESEQNIRQIFANARKHPLSVVFVDEMEAIFSKRTDNVHEVTQRIVSVILQELDGIDSEKNPILLLGATNTPWKIDEAFLRPGRFDVHAFVGLPDLPARKQILEGAFKQSALPRQEGLIDYIADNTASYSGADLNGLVTAIRQQAFEMRSSSYTMQLAYEIMLANPPSSKHETLARIREWERRN